MDVSSLSPQELAKLKEMDAKLKPIFEEERQRIAMLLAFKPDERILGEGEFELRDLVHALAARSLEVTLAERKKGDT